MRSRLPACLATPLLGALLAACSNSSGAADAGPDLAEQPPPPAICKTPGAPAARWFTEVTADVGLAPSATLVPLATSVRGADLDGDGYVDLVATVPTTVGRDVNTPGMRYRFLFMNRPDPADPTGKRRIFVDSPDSGISATRDGVGGRAFGPTCLGDLDNDGDVDLAACPGSDQSPDECDVLLNDGHAHFTFANSSDLQAQGPFEAATGALFDYDRDGVLDYFPGTYGIAPLLFKGRGDGTFQLVSAAVGLPTVDGDPTNGTSFRRMFGLTACDLDGDGDQDVLLADYGREFNQVWINQGGTFTEMGMGLGVAADDRLDFTDDQSYLCWCAANAGKCPPSTAAPLITCDNPCNPNVERCWSPGIDDQPWRLAGNTFSIACGDIDDDGDMDLMTAEIRHWDVGSSSDPSELLRNDTPAGAALMKFVRPGNDVTGLARPSAERGSWNEGDMMPVFADIDLDGRKDIYLTSSDYPGDHGWLFHQKPDGTFEDVTAATGAGQKQIHGIALVDIDNDGDLDLVAGTSTARGVAATQALRVYRNDVGQDENWVQVRLVGLGGAPHANRSAIGARVMVTAGGRTQVQEVSGGYGHESIQNDLVLTFGLGSTCTIDKVEVVWPNAPALRSTWTDVRANYRVQLTEGDARVVYLNRP